MRHNVKLLQHVIIKYYNTDKTAKNNRRIYLFLIPDVWDRPLCHGISRSSKPAVLRSRRDLF